MSELIKAHIPYGTPAWYKYRETGIGGSDVGAILGQSDYTSLARMFYEKIGEIPPRFYDNAAMYWGRKTEPLILDVWSYWDGTDYIGNPKQREYYQNEFYARNPKFDHLFGETDGMISKGQANLITGELLKRDGVLEAKTINGWFAKKWELGVPKTYISQINTYMLIFDADYAEIAILADGRDFNVIPFEKNKALCDKILDETFKFWYEKVVPAKEFVINKNKAISKGDAVAADEYTHMIHELEPGADASDDYSKFASDLFQGGEDVFFGTEVEYNLAAGDKILNAYISALKTKKKLIENKFREIFKNENVSEIEFDQGKVKYFKKKGSDNLQVGNYIKTVVDKDIVDTNLTIMFRQTDLNI